MMTDESKNDIPRRDFLWAASMMPLALALGCSKDASPVEAETAIRKFILAVGPWGEDQRERAEDFATRFLAARGVSSAFLAQGDAAASLASRAPFRDEALALESLDLSGCSEAERNLLTSLVTQIYGLLEVHSDIAGVPDVGICAGREQYTRAPSEWSAPYRRPR